MTNLDDSRPRLYLLGRLSEEQCVALEEEYLRREEVLDRVSAAEDDLIADYLDGRLTRDEREHFERHYLASPVHRQRVAVSRQLRVAAAREHEPETAPLRTSGLSAFIRSWLAPPFALKGALAALVLTIAVGAVWMVRARLETETSRPTVAERTTISPQPAAPEPPPVAPQQPPVVLAISLSPSGVRSAEDSPPVTIPSGTDRLSVNLESDGPTRALSQARAAVHTVPGREVWTGPATGEASARPPIMARIDVPAERLPPDDYVVTLFESRDGGPEIEVFRYFLRIRAR